MNDESIIVLKAKELRQLLREELDRTHRPPEPDMNPGERLTRRDAAKFLDISYQTMYNWTRDGIIQEHGAGKKKFYLKSELLQVIKNSNAKNSK
jgi:hypothetical protein